MVIRFITDEGKAPPDKPAASTGKPDPKSEAADEQADAEALPFGKPPARQKKPKPPRR